jgi:hypothetical protein
MCYVFPQASQPRGGGGDVCNARPPPWGAKGQGRGRAAPGPGYGASYPLVLAMPIAGPSYGLGLDARGLTSRNSTCRPTSSLCAPLFPICIRTRCVTVPCVLFWRAICRRVGGRRFRISQVHVKLEVRAVQLAPQFIAYLKLPCKKTVSRREKRNEKSTHLLVPRCDIIIL